MKKNRAQPQSRHLHQIEIDAKFFVHRLTQAVEKLRKPIRQSLQTTISRDPTFKKGLEAWAKKQGIANFADEAFYNATARQLVYRILGKILFYQSLQGHKKELDPIDFSGLDIALVIPRLWECFEKARQIDYQAVFGTDICEQIPFPEPAVQELCQLISDLNNYNFSTMPHDVMGQVFEQLIPPEERHSLG